MAYPRFPKKQKSISKPPESPETPVSRTPQEAVSSSPLRGEDRVEDPAIGGGEGSLSAGRPVRFRKKTKTNVRTPRKPRTPGIAGGVTCIPLFPALWRG